MKIFFKALSILLTLLLLSGCDDRNEGAKLRLQNARKYYQDNEYTSAKLEIDSLKLLFPAAYPEIKASRVLLDSVRRGENIQIVAIYDSLINDYDVKLKALKSKFIYQRNIHLQDKGLYTAKEAMFTNEFRTTSLRAGITEEGLVYLESVYIGKQKHNKVKISSKDGYVAETQPVKGDGFNYRFNSLGGEREILRFIGASENGVVKFVNENRKKSLTVTLMGESSHKYDLPRPVVKAIADSYELALMIQHMNNLRAQKEKAEFRIYYLDNIRKNNAKKREEKIIFQ